MPGPKMGPRPADFDEDLIRQSPTFIKWSQLGIGEKLRYACREFVRGQGDDEERLMRRIMIARRNNIRDHQTLKRARQLTVRGPTEENSSDSGAANQPRKAIKTESSPRQDVPTAPPTPSTPPPSPPPARKRRPSTLFSDAEVAKEMDVPAVEATRSYRSWLALRDGDEFIYNQKYVKGKEGHDWLLRKNVWRRMRYRRENKKMVARLRQTHPSATESNEEGVDAPMGSRQILAPYSTHPDSSAPPSTVAASSSDPPKPTQEADGDFEVSAAVEAAVAVAESYANSAYNVVHNPLEAAATSAALDAAARLAAAAAANPSNLGDDGHSQYDDAPQDGVTTV